MDNLSASASASALVQSGLLNIDMAFDLQVSAQKAELEFIEYLVKHSVLSPKIIAQQLASYFDYNFLKLQFTDINLNLSSYLSLELVQNFKVLPLYIHKSQFYIAMADPSQHEYIRQLKFYSGLEVIPVVVEYDKLQNCLRQYFVKLGHETDIASDKSQNDIADEPVVKYVNLLLTKAIAKYSSDIHFEPYENSYRIRLRLDGVLYTIPSQEKFLATEVCARIKILANLNIVEKRMPQDGRFTFKFANSTLIDCRVSICPTIHGEKVVIRFLNLGNRDDFNIQDLCLNSRDNQEFVNALCSPQGLILVSGPTGSGKSTTLYTALNYLNTNAVNIVSVEDPVEMHIAGINQVQVSTNLGFAKVLRAVLRQDPDIIMLGEIRDLETAQIAVQAAQTGHLVLASIHTNSATQTLSRLINIGVPIYNLLDSLRLIVAQRLLRKLCKECRQIQKFSNDKGCSAITDSDTAVYAAGFGCRHCNNGYKGRQAIFEVMPISMEIKEYLQVGSFTDSQLEKIACQQGMQLLKNAGIEQVIAGNTSGKELQRVCEI